MSDSAADFIWYELMTTDTVAAEAFYKAVVGWGATAADGPHTGYTIFTVEGSGVAGSMAMPEPMVQGGAPPCWVGYIGVDDCDAYAAKIAEKGGKVYRAPDDIPLVGRFAVVADPHGAVFNIMKPQPMDGAPRERPPGEALGMPGWRELYAGDGVEAFKFYSEMFGWEKGNSMDMGAMGVYQMFSANGQDIGGMMTKTPDIPVPCWQYYFIVDDINAAKARIEENGGKSIMGPHEVPGNIWILQAMDPQGAMFAVMAMPKAS